LRLRRNLQGTFREEPHLLAFSIVGFFGLGQQIAGEFLKRRVGDQAHRVEDAFLFAVVIQSGHSEARVGPYLYVHFGPSLPQTDDYALQEGHRRVGGVGVARPQQSTDQVPALPVEDDQRMIHVLLVVAVANRTWLIGAFLIAVGGVCGGVEIQEHPLWSSAVFGPLSKVELEDGLGYSVATAPVGCVLKPREGRLARQISPALG